MKLGIIGGLSPESTIEYYRVLTTSYFNLKGEFPNMLIESIDVYKLLDLCDKGELSELTDYLMNAGEVLLKGDAEVIAIAANTPHLVFNEVQSRLPIPVISIVEATAEAITQQGIQRVGLIGTKFTMEQSYFKHPLQEIGLKVYTPLQKEIDYITQSIHDELERGIFKKETRQRYLDIILNLQNQHQIEGIILGCTEIPLLLKDVSCPIHMFDTMQIHIAKLLNCMLK
ncbi:MAG: amino acid racemase [Tannerellaceae bacterium]|nr:amino acid racemase [Tannerellaceae bacterium]